MLLAGATRTSKTNNCIIRLRVLLRGSSRSFASSTTVKEKVFRRRQRDEQSYAASRETPPPPPRRLALLSSRLTDNFLDQPTVWHEFSPLAIQHQAVNLGQGFPDWDPPPFVIEALHQAAAATGHTSHQYARSAAHMPLAEVLAQIYSERWNTIVNPSTQVATTVGCTQALYCALHGLVDPGDEVVMFEPAFDIYDAQVKLAEGVSLFVPLRRSGDDDHDATIKKGAPEDASSNSSSSSDDAAGGRALRNSNQVFQIDWNALEVALSRKPRVLILNTPHNPTGKIFTPDELKRIAQMLSPETIVITDEVYEYLVFDGHEHTSMANLLPDQTLTLSSAGKTFSCTGWKVGWAVGPARLVRAVSAVQQWVNFSAPTPNQQAIAQCLIEAHNPFVDPMANRSYDNYYQYLSATYQGKRDLLVPALLAAGMTPIVPPGGFFVMADTASIEFPYEEKYQNTTTDAMPNSPMPRDWALARWLTETVGVTAIPPCNFYSPRNRHVLAPNLLRFAFCKSDDTLREGHRRLADYFGGKSKTVVQ